MAVSSPTPPPILVKPAPAASLPQAPIARMKNVIASRTKTTVTILAAASEAIAMYAVKIPQDSRNRPTNPLATCSVDTAGFVLPIFAPKNQTKRTELSQNAPNEQNAVAAKVLPRRNAQSPATNWARPP